MSADGAVRSIKIIWELVDRVTAPARKVDEQVDKILGKGGDVAKKYQEATTNSSNKVVQAYQNAEQAVDKYTNGLKSRLTGAAKSIEDHKMAIAGIGAAFAGAGYLGLNYYSEGTKDLATYQSAYDALLSKLGTDTDSFIYKLREASGSQLTDTSLVTNANMAMLLGIPEDALPKMTEMARAAARQLPGDMAYYYQSIMTGTARESKLWLDNLGIIVDIDEARNNYAKTLGISADALTTEQERLAFINEVLAHSDDLLKDVDFSQQNLKETLGKSTAAWENLQTELTEGALPVISATANANNFLADALNAMPEPMKAVIGTGGLVGSTLLGITGTLLIQLAALSLISSEWPTLTGLLYGVVPASISAAYAEGGLTAATWALGASLWAIAVNPITLAILAIVGAAWLLWDVFDKGWEDSMLGQAVRWLYDTFPGLERWVTGTTLAFEYLSGSLAEVWKYLEPIVDQISGALDNPYVKLILDAMWGITPMGLADNLWRIGSGQNLAIVDDYSEILGGAYRTQEIAGKAYGSQNRTLNINIEKLDASLNTGDLRTEGVTKDDLNSIMDKRDQKLQSGMTRMIKGELKAVGA
ncbi:MAG: magnesium transporter [Methanomicrobiaceae archaeon]|nr:magnesium transporter [Methanomicrobiaceae archaeon]